MGTKKKFSGWSVMIGCFLLYFCGAALVSNTSALFMNPVCTEFGVDSTAYSVITLVSSITSAIGSIILAPKLQKGKMKIIMIACAVATGALYSLMSVATQLWHMYIIFGLCNMTLAGLSQLPISLLITCWFNKKRSLSMGIAFCGGSVGGAFWSIVMAGIIDGAGGWRSAYLIGGIVAAVTCIAITLLFIKQHPAQYGQEALGSEDDAGEGGKADANSWIGVDKGVAVKSSAFWTLALCMFLIGALAAGVSTHSANYLVTSGWTTVAAAGVISVFSLISIIGNLAGGIIFEKLGPKGGTAAAAACSAIGLVALFLAKSIPFMGYVYGVFFGLAMMMPLLIPALLISSVFGTKDYGTLYSLLNVIFLLGCSLGSIFTGIIANSAGYGTAWIVFAVCSVLVYVFAASALAGSKKLRAQYPNPVTEVPAE